MGMKSKRILSAISAGALFVSLITPYNFAAADNSNTITISNAGEFLEFAKNCTLDSWSKNKTVTLADDIDLGYNDFSPIPIFGGTFNGNGHSINGLRITAQGSGIGLFRYVEKGGKIENLEVHGIVAPEGSQNVIGGIVGENYGTIKDCTFGGSVTGEKNVGGIVGNNAESGQVISCETLGKVHGMTATGGIAGNNSGTLIKCENNAGINLTQDNEEELSTDIDVDKILDGTETEEDSILNSCSDTGGIVGYSDGIVQSCVNHGDVGYPHVGYNAGGIAGRQSGYISGCTNDGTILGRKEVGGIVGQTEPYLSITPSEDLLGELRTELDKLTEMIDGTLSDAQNMGNTMSGHLTNIKNSADSAKDDLQSISNGMNDFVNGNIESVNMVTADISNAIDIAKPAVDDFSELGAEISEISDLLSDTFEILKKVAEITDTASKDVEKAIENLRNCAESIKTASQQISDALDELQTSVIEDDAQAFKNAAEALKRAAEAMEGVFNDLGDVSESIDKILEWIEKIDTSTSDSLPDISLPDSMPNTSLPDSLPETSFPDISLPDSLPDISFAETEVSRTSLSARTDTQNSTDDLSAALKDFADAVGKIADSLPTIKDDLEKAGEKMQSAMDSAEKAADSFIKALDNLRDAIDDVKPVNDYAKQALDKLSLASNHASNAGKLCEHAFGCISDAVDSLSDIDKSPFKPLSGDIRKNSDSLFDTLSKMFAEAEQMNADFNEEGSAFLDKLKAINTQVGVITDLVIDEINTLTGGNDSLSLKDHIQDTSEDDITSTRDGKIADCINNGSVEGDRNVGGIAGSMAIEYDLDPEDDVTNKISTKAKYETKSVLQSCINYGKVTAKKDGAGGLVGRMDLGTAINSENYGEIKGTDYVGGAVGYSDASVRGCFTKSRLSGTSYIGGIAGYANRLSGCYAITTILDGSEFVGAIAGNINKDGLLKDNGFIDTGVAGVDGISYSGRAEPISFDKLKKVEDLPVDMTTFRIILNADEKQVAEIPFSYGQDLSKITLPDVPEKDDNYGVWPDFDKSGKQSDIVLEAVYNHVVTITQSEEADGKLALALAAGNFTDDVTLEVSEENIAKPSGAGKDAKIYRLTLKNTNVGENDTVPIRLLNPSTNKAKVWILSGENWVSVDASQSGKYMLAQMTGTEGVFCIAPANPVWIPFAAGGAAVVILVVVIICVKKAKKRKKEKSALKNQ